MLTRVNMQERWGGTDLSRQHSTPRKAARQASSLL